MVAGQEYDDSLIPCRARPLANDVTLQARHAPVHEHQAVAFVLLRHELECGLSIGGAVVLDADLSAVYQTENVSKTATGP